MSDLHLFLILNMYEMFKEEKFEDTKGIIRGRISKDYTMAKRKRGSCYLILSFVQCFVDHCLSFFFWALSFLSLPYYVWLPPFIFLNYSCMLIFLEHILSTLICGLVHVTRFWLCVQYLLIVSVDFIFIMGLLFRNWP